MVELGCLPLALEQTGAHIRSLQCPLSKYLEQYKRERLQLLSEHQAIPRGNTSLEVVFQSTLYGY